MKRNRRFLLLALTTALLLCVPAAAIPSTDHAPALTILAPFAPSDLKVTVTIFKDTRYDQRVIPVTLEQKQKGWEMQYYLRREGVYAIREWYGNTYDFKNATLTLQQGGEDRTFAIPAELLTERGAEDYIKLDWRTGKMTALSPLRAPLLLLMWAAIAIVVEGVVFWFFGYRSKRSWIILILVNLVTQAAHHAIIAGVNVDINNIRVYWISVPLLVLTEMVTLVMLLDEQDHDTAATFSVRANVASTAVVGMLMFTLPS